MSESRTIDLEALDRSARFERARRVLGWVSLPVGFFTLVGAVFAGVVALAMGFASEEHVVRTAIVLVASPVPIAALFTHYRLLSRTQREVNAALSTNARAYTRAWITRIAATFIGLFAVSQAYDSPLLRDAMTDNWPVRAVLLVLAVLGGYVAVLPLVLAGAEFGEARLRARRGSSPWLIAIALISSLMFPETPPMWMFGLVCGLYALRVLTPEFSAVQALEADEPERAQWWCRRMPALTGPFLRVRVLRALGALQEAEAEARRAATSWSPVRDAARLLTFLAELAGERGDADGAWRLATAAARINPNLPQAYGALAAADLYTNRADELTLELVERAREHADRSFPRQPGERSAEFRALHAWALAATGNRPGAEEAWAGAKADLVGANATVRRAAEVYLAKAKAIVDSATS